MEGIASASKTRFTRFDEIPVLMNRHRAIAFAALCIRDACASRDKNRFTYIRELLQYMYRDTFDCPQRLNILTTTHSHLTGGLLLRPREQMRGIVISASVSVSTCLSICLSVCLSDRISPEPTRDLYQIFAHVAFVRASVLLWYVDDRPHRLSAGRG